MWQAVSLVMGLSVLRRKFVWQWGDGGAQFLDVCDNWNTYKVLVFARFNENKLYNKTASLGPNDRIYQIVFVQVLRFVHVFFWRKGSLWERRHTRYKYFLMYLTSSNDNDPDGQINNASFIDVKNPLQSIKCSF